jgi:hypothetical protein
VFVLLFHRPKIHFEGLMIITGINSPGPRLRTLFKIKEESTKDLTYFHTISSMSVAGGRCETLPEAT